MAVIETVKEAIGLGHSDAAPSPASREAMSEAKLPLAYRDSCAGLLIPLNKCRHDTFFAIWKCENERHTYEKCQYEEFKKRVARMKELRAAKASESNAVA
ncbi:NADH dehydrogenase (ubiquinone) 1 beta subcomplex 7 [Exophiala aquamarina CBS 119918]|uniref:NADH dehydrogenase [ubiquinone] 1 beta subcomplex subunit 7 n=1 Tax=Exophiala aquamarina CBS 119918 TaxID=1182545 RepID=A0A072PDK3_9EURO|nr:NADH dehydrogenase (ubiquinone) 1 beta subcomplex 7 [Exophiala aquamarina CBS 119918]KEF57363.1 NADH dehydrogenase (ubiquinone) 1 beta subcomplex 7 [Exophiala aquamarina CBS 119918]